MSNRFSLKALCLFMLVAQTAAHAASPAAPFSLDTYRAKQSALNEELAALKGSIAPTNATRSVAMPVTMHPQNPTLATPPSPGKEQQPQLTEDEM